MQMHSVERLSEYVILIPAYNPDRALVELIQSLKREGFVHVVVVNDGSDETCRTIFDELRPDVSALLEHEKNAGKGAALKTGIGFIIDRFPDTTGVITVDADGQHLPEDVHHVYDQGVLWPHHLIMGCRDFTGDEIPLRSRFGNQVTRLVMTIGSGLRLKDTQTGLRAIPIRYAQQLLDVPGNRYEFEMNMLTFTKRLHVPIHQTPIQTVYVDENASSHFRPVIDSILIYRMFLAYSLSSVASFLMDIGVYALLIFILNPWFETTHVIVATVIGRIISSLFNYYVNRKIVFKSKARRAMVKYFSLVGAQMALSAGLVYALFFIFRDGEVILKVIVDSFLFVVSYYVQKRWIFKR
ncbi:bifunctional glycosyltransferase family 2/GtrA family protein [Exiguobacterium sp.]|uniref:bifunctional glycosyltransferase family 2/GtrA family protein n=1 Tax=Exiguobacterium sp. TaxID=44751 RepID=UPI00263BBAFB|nr:bifunctional glycosyltransferase family 2/GtrA family protein [Exiguobacterium sp.]MCC5891230.1 bifunctional glycosyltransferase family 2/GtrA family protein [Exiguobacterium sp.]